jgi:hypothetical protein
MVARRYASFEPITKIDVDQFIWQQREGGVDLGRRHCLAVENALREYERFHYLVEIGEGKQLPPKLLKMEKALRVANKSIAAVREEEGYIWEYLVDQSGVEGDFLQDLLTATEKLNKSTRKYDPKQINARLLSGLMRRLADIYTEATRRPARISKGVPSRRDPFQGGRGGPFLRFARAALAQLPSHCRPRDQTISGVGSRFERIMADAKAGRPISPHWIGLPYPALARPSWKKNTFRQRTGKKP